jgi:predicted benzoate:H+ symporter BenE
MPTLKGAAVIIVVSWSYWILREIGQAFYGLITEIVYLRKNR